MEKCGDEKWNVQEIEIQGGGKWVQLQLFVRVLEEGGGVFLL